VAEFANITEPNMNMKEDDKENLPNNHNHAVSTFVTKNIKNDDKYEKEAFG
jgi:hypothetical protein